MRATHNPLPVRRSLGLIAASLCLAAAAASAAPAEKPPGALEARIARGHELARANCSRCHAIEGDGASPSRRAPPFRTLAGHYVELTLHMKLVEIAESGHYDMPPQPVHTDEVGDLAAYINSLPRP